MTLNPIIKFYFIPAAKGKCEPGQFKCLSGDRCLSLRKVCNRKKDCADGSDEMMCKGRK